MSLSPLVVSGCGIPTPSSATSDSQRSRCSSRASTPATQMWGIYGPLGRCPSLAKHRSYRQVSHRPTFVDETLFRPSPPGHNISVAHVSSRGDGERPRTQPHPGDRAGGQRRAPSAVQRSQTRYRMVRRGPSHVDFGLFAPTKDSQFWSAMEEWYEPDTFNKGKHGLFDTAATQIINENDVQVSLTATRMKTQPSRQLWNRSSCF